MRTQLPPCFDTPIASLQVAITENVPLKDRLKQMSKSGSSSRAPSRSGMSSPTSSGPAPPRQLDNSRQPSVKRDAAAAVPADGLPELNLSAGKQATARPGLTNQASAKVTKVLAEVSKAAAEVTKAAAVSSALQKAACQGELTPSELKVLARKLKAEKQAGHAPQASALDKAVPSSKGHPAASSSGKAGPSSMGPPAARGKRPPLPDRSLLPPKKRRATEGALPPSQGRPLAAAQVPQRDKHASKSANAIISKQVMRCLG